MKSEKSAAARRAAELLWPATGHLYGVLDAARTVRIPSLLRQSGNEHASLYEGLQGEVLSNFGPFLVRFGDDGRLLAQVLSEGWGESWGIFIQSSAAMRHLRTHLRRFLMVNTEAGKRLYFRYYDPRVLRTFMPLTTPRQATAVFAEVDAFLVEDEHATSLCKYSLSAGRTVVESLPLAIAAER